MKKKYYIISVAIIVCLFGIVVFSSLLMRGNIAKNSSSFDNFEILVKHEGNETKIDRNILKSIGAQNFNAIYDTSDTEPKLESYTGVELKDILKHCDIEISENAAVIISSVDNFTVAYSGSEVLKEKNAFLAFEEGGKELKTKEDGGTGPYETIIASDKFSNRRCKWVVSIEVEG
jgi:hypothetical protein